MILILAYWCFLALLFLPAGLLVQRLLKLQKDDIVLVLTQGMFLSTLFFTASAFFLPLNGIVFTAFAVVNCVLLYTFRIQIKLLVLNTVAQFRVLATFERYVFIFLFLGALLKSAQLPGITDNESYYVQTIKWFGEYGMVTGLGNLHLFFAQSSPWHILHAGLDLHFFTDRINDINGFLYVVCSFYYITTGREHQKSTGTISWIGLLPALSAIFFLFLDSPSPDLPLVLLVPIILLLYLEDPKKNYTLYSLLIIFLIFIKVTIAPLALLMLFNYNLKKHWAVTFIAIFSGSLWVLKNCMLSGYPLYPFTSIAIDRDWTIPRAILLHVHETSNAHVYGTPSIASPALKFISWLTLPGIHGTINALIVMLFVLILIFRKIRTNTRYTMVYIVFLIHFITLLVTSPQFRFFLPEILFFLAFMGAQIINIITINYKAYYAVTACGCAVTLFTFGMIRLNSLPGAERQRLHFSQVYLPATITAFSGIRYDKRTLMNLDYYSPSNTFFLYGTADGPLPCVNKRQIKNFAHKLGVIPQLRGKTLSDGFYTKDLRKKD